jgi:hypothetical protein
LSLDLDDENARPYFLWDTTWTVRELRAALSNPDEKSRIYWMARVLRDARYADVWRFVTLRDVLLYWDELAPRLGRERARWDFLIEGWRADGLIP